MPTRIEQVGFCDKQTHEWRTLSNTLLSAAHAPRTRESSLRSEYIYFMALVCEQIASDYAVTHRTLVCTKRHDGSYFGIVAFGAEQFVQELKKASGGLPENRSWAALIFFLQHVMGCIPGGDDLIHIVVDDCRVQNSVYISESVTNTLAHIFKTLEENDHPDQKVG